MLFTSTTFWIFFALVFTALRLNAVTIKSVLVQNSILLAGSYVFYAAWDYRFISLILLSTFVDYLAGWQIARNERATVRRIWLIVSVCANLGILGFFKYFNFFAGELQILLNSVGMEASWPTLNIILPVGISFFTFQTMTYTIDVYWRKMQWEPNLLRYATFVAFFPQLVAGPIERARNLLPQFHRVAQVSWNGIYQGISLVIFGLFLKLVIADSLAPLVDEIFATAESRNGGELLLGAIYFACQIYGDFCGYSTIAIGVASMMGFRLMTNFLTPYRATSIRDFWRTWHISLSTFFRDYVYIPLGGSRNSTSETNRNLIVTFLLSGLWHGANWTFIAWGGIHSLALIASSHLSHSVSRASSRGWSFLGWTMTMMTVLICWVIFRSPDIGYALDYIIRMISDLEQPQFATGGLIYVALIPLIDLLWHRDVRLDNGLSIYVKNPVGHMMIEAIILAGMFHIIWVFHTTNGGNNAFIYFQF